ncbi:hypothetical protein [Rhodococcus wratislaviensis]|uniref:hypothetical protein n=1 Tax=Rhodococcus wratislaviensis TaxID=44752 RepID=UPI003519C61F
MDTAVAQWAGRRGRRLTLAETSKYVQTHLVQSVDMQIVITGECRWVRRLSGGGWQMDLAAPHGRAVDCIPVYFSKDVAAAVGAFLKHRVGRRFGDHITNGAGVTIAGILTVSSYTRALQLRANQIYPERTDPGPVTVAENAHRDRLESLGFPKSLFTKGIPISLKWPDKLRHITVISSNGSKAVTDIEAMLGKVRVGVPTLDPVVVSMNRHQIAEHLTTPSAFGTQLAGQLYKTTAAQRKITPAPTVHTQLHAAKTQATGAHEDYRARYDQLVQWHTATTHNTHYWWDAYVDELRTGSAAPSQTPLRSGSHRDTAGRHRARHGDRVAVTEPHRSHHHRSRDTAARRPVLAHQNPHDHPTTIDAIPPATAEHPRLDPRHPQSPHTPPIPHPVDTHPTRAHTTLTPHQQHRCGCKW